MLCIIVDSLLKRGMIIAKFSFLSEQQRINHVNVTTVVSHMLNTMFLKIVLLCENKKEHNIKFYTTPKQDNALSKKLLIR